MTKLNESTTVREISVTDSKTTQVVKHFHFKGWPDWQIPIEATQKDFSTVIDHAAHFVMANKRLGTADREKLVVHCKAGIGRTGTTIALINATISIQEQLLSSSGSEPSLSLFSIVRRLREQRIWMC